MDFFDKVERLLAEKDVTIGGLAEEASFDRTQFSRWRDNYRGNKRGGPTIWQGLRIARFLKVPLEYLADDRQEKPESLTLGEDERTLIEVFRAIQPDIRSAIRAISKLGIDVTVSKTPPSPGPSPPMQLPTTTIDATGHPPGREADDAGKRQKGA